MLRPSLVSCTRRANNIGIKKYAHCCTCISNITKALDLVMAQFIIFGLHVNAETILSQWNLHFRFCILTFPLGQPFFDGHPLNTGERQEARTFSHFQDLKGEKQILWCTMLPACLGCSILYFPSSSPSSASRLSSSSASSSFLLSFGTRS